VLETYGKLKGRLENLAPQLCRASGFAFYNTSPYTFERLLADAPNLAANLRAYKYLYEFNFIFFSCEAKY
jgi:type I restriction enzyme M protein